MTRVVSMVMLIVVALAAPRAAEAQPPTNIQRRGKTAKLIRDPGLKPGEPLDKSELFPLVWERE